MRRYGPLTFSSLILAGILTGCAASQAIMIASQMVDGVSYLATGKSTTDHALSGALDEDCALHRLIEGAAVCKEKPPVPANDIQTASLAGAPVLLPDDVVEELAEDLIEGHEVSPVTGHVTGPVTGTAEPLAQQAAPEMDQKSGQSPGQVAQTSDQSARVSRGFGADMFFVPHHAGDADAPVKNKNLAGDTPILPDSAKVVPVPEKNTAAAPVADSVSTPSVGKPDKQFFIVLGSFSTRGNAQLATKQMPDSVTPVLVSHAGPRIAVADIRGRTFYRVILGPLDRPTTVQARRQFVAAGLRNTWMIAACGGVISTGCVAGH
jgi:hypothetical protein